MKTFTTCTLLLALTLGVALHTTATAQTATRIGNEFIAAHVVTTPKSGRFWMTAGSMYNDTLRFLYASGAGFITSNVIFRFQGNGIDNYYSNVPPTFGWQPTHPATGQPIPYKPYDSLYLSADTMALVWKSMEGYTIVMRFIPEKPTSDYATGGDMLIEFTAIPGGFSSATVGVMMMLDLINSDALAISGGGAGDKSSVLSDIGYFVSGREGTRRTQPNDSIPHFYHVGNFGRAAPLNRQFPIHRLQDTSHGGRALTRPDMFAIGDWAVLRTVGWDPPSSIETAAYSDVAAIIRWDSLRPNQTVRTAFGMNDRSGNDMFTCRDSSLFIDIRTQRVTRQYEENGAYTHETIDVEMWVANTDSDLRTDVEIRLNNPVGQPSSASGRLTIDSSTPATQSLSLSPAGVQKLRWRLNIDTSSRDTLVRLLFDKKYSEQNVYSTLMEGCTPQVSVIPYGEIPPPAETDTLAPNVVTTRNGQTDGRWQLELVDGNRGYTLDSGIDTVRIVSNENFNMSIGEYERCDTTERVQLDATVIDLQQPALLVLEVVDCSGNVSVVTVERDGTVGVDVAGVDRARLRLVRPQPARAGERVMIDVVGLDNGIHPLHISSIDGREVARLEVTAPVGGDGTIMFELPEGLIAGTYVVVVGEAAVVIVVE